MDVVRHVAEAERARLPGETRLAEAVARYLDKLMAYEDEFEVARLHLRPEVRASSEAAFGHGAVVRYRLHLPVLHALGLRRKFALGRWVETLRSQRRLWGEARALGAAS